MPVKGQWGAVPWTHLQECAHHPQVLPPTPSSLAWLQRPTPTLRRSRWHFVAMLLQEAFSVEEATSQMDMATKCCLPLLRGWVGLCFLERLHSPTWGLGGAAAAGIAAPSNPVPRALAPLAPP